MSEYIVDTFGIVQDFADLHGDMNTPLYQAIMDVMVSRQREEIVRCNDCVYMSDDGLTIAWCNENCREVRPRDYCAWGYKK